MILTALLLLLSHNIYAYQVSGSNNLQHKKFNNLTSKGYLQFSDLHITGNFTSHGSAVGEKLKCNNFVVSGSIKASDLTASFGSVKGAISAHNLNISGDLKLSGEIYITKSILGNVEITSNAATFKDSKIHNIMVKNNNNKEQKITLANKTIISGDVTFESGNGKIYLDNSSKIEGKITGATIVHD